MTMPRRIDITASVFDLCPLFVVLVIAALGIAQIDSAILGMPLPLRDLSIEQKIVEMLIFAIPFALATGPATWRGWVNVLAAGLILPLGQTIMPWVSTETIWALPFVYDPQVVALDGALGFQPSFVLGDAFARDPLFAAICIGIYAAVILPTALVALAEGYRGRRTGPGALPIFLVIGGFGFTLYHLFPVIGPASNFIGSYPYPELFGHDPGPRNAMPSCHTAWVLMAFLTSRGMHWTIRILLAVAALGTMIATLGTGAHYLTDLIVACPFVLLVRAVCAIGLPLMAPERIGPALSGAGMIAAWGLAVRGVIAPAAIPGLVPAVMLATVVASYWLEHKLALAERRTVRFPAAAAMRARPVGIDQR